MTESKVLMETFKGFEIYYDKEKERFVSDKPKLDIHFEARTLWEMKGCIKETKIEEINKLSYVKSGYFGKSISKINMLTINKETKRCKYKILETTNKDYDEGRIKDEQDVLKTYEINDENKTIYDNVKKLEEEIKKMEMKQQELVEKLKW